VGQRRKEGAWIEKTKGGKGYTHRLGDQKPFGLRIKKGASSGSGLEKVDNRRWGKARQRTSQQKRSTSGRVRIDDMQAVE